MGFVWNVLLSFDNDEFWEEGDDEPGESCTPLDQINAWIEHGRLVNLTDPTYRKGAGYGMDANLYGGGFKHFDIEGFIDLVKAQDWKARSKVQLWIKGAEAGMGDEPFSLVKLGRRRSQAATKAAGSRKRGAAAANAAETKKRRAAGSKAAATPKAKRERRGAKRQGS